MSKCLTIRVFNIIALTPQLIWCF